MKKLSELSERGKRKRLASLPVAENLNAYWERLATLVEVVKRCTVVEPLEEAG